MLRSLQPPTPLQCYTIVSKSQLYKISEHSRIFSPAPMLENFESTQIGVIHGYNHVLYSPLLFLMRCRIVVDPPGHNKNNYDDGSDGSPVSSLRRDSQRTVRIRTCPDTFATGFGKRLCSSIHIHSNIMKVKRILRRVSFLESVKSDPYKRCVCHIIKTCPFLVPNQPPPTYCHEGGLKKAEIKNLKN